MSNIENGQISPVKSEIVWSDRKHRLWFPLSFTKYSIGNGRIYINTGLLTSREDECLLYRVTDITLTRSIGQKICGTGTISLNTKDASTPVIKLENIKNASDVKRMLSELVEKDREEKNVVGRDMYGAASHVDPVGPHPGEF